MSTQSASAQQACATNSLLIRARAEPAIILVPGGPAGPAGPNSLISGYGPPSNDIGTDGQFYVNLQDNELWGPKGEDTPGEWPSPPIQLGDSGATVRSYRANVTLVANTPFLIPGTTHLLGSGIHSTYVVIRSSGIIPGLFGGDEVHPTVNSDDASGDITLTSHITLPVTVIIYS